MPLDKKQVKKLLARASVIQKNQAIGIAKEFISVEETMQKIGEKVEILKDLVYEPIEIDLIIE